MLLEPVVRQFAQFARLDEESAAPWVPLCEAAAAWIESMRDRKSTRLNSSHA